MGGFIIQLSPSLVSTRAGKRRLQLPAFDQSIEGGGWLPAVSEEMPPPTHSSHTHQTLPDTDQQTLPDNLSVERRAA